MKRISLAIVMLFSFLLTQSSHARIDVLPKNIILQKRDRAGDMLILNLSDERRDFEVRIINYRQKPDGAYIQIDEPLDPDFDTDSIVRYSPRSFSLGPGGKQKVRISLRKPADLPEKEYRFHIMGISYPSVIRKSEVSEDIQVSMTANVAVSIPVIIRHGDLSADGSIGEFRLTQTPKGQPTLDFTATREGTASTLGNIDVFWAQDGGSYNKIGFLTNYNIYTEQTTRSYSVPLEVMPTSGRLKVVYYDDYTNKVYDEVELDL